MGGVQSRWRCAGYQQIAYATHRETDCTSTPAMGTFESTLVTRLASRQVDVARRPARQPLRRFQRRHLGAAWRSGLRPERVQ